MEKTSIIDNHIEHSIVSCTHFFIQSVRPVNSNAVTGVVSRTSGDATVMCKSLERRDYS